MLYRIRSFAVVFGSMRNDRFLVVVVVVAGGEEGGIAAGGARRDRFLFGLFRVSTCLF